MFRSVMDTCTDKGKSVSRSLAAVYSLPGFIVYQIPRILIRTFLCIGKHFERPFLGLCICPGLPDPVPSALLFRNTRAVHDSFHRLAEPVHGVSHPQSIPEMLRIPMVGSDPPAVPFPVADDHAIRGRVQIVLFAQISKQFHCRS